VRIFSPRRVSRAKLVGWSIPAIVGLGVLFLAGCAGGDSSIIDPQGPVAYQQSVLFWFIFIVATLVFTVVESMLIYSVVRFRARPNSPEPRQIHGNTRLEIAWTIVPSLVLFMVLGYTIYTLVGIQEPANKAQTFVNVVGHQWWWEFRYFESAGDAQIDVNVQNGQTVENAPTPTIVTADELVVPTGTVVHLNLISTNVIHSFWIPKLAGKTDVIPGHNNHMWFQADVASTYPGACAEFCGDQHAHMRFEVKSMAMSDYRAWTTAQQQPAHDPDTGTPKLTCEQGWPGNNATLALQGKYYFFCKTFTGNNACISCHSVYGSTYGNIKALGVVGPNLTHFGSRDLIAGGVLNNTPDDLAKWLTDPQQWKPGNDMPNMGISPDEVQALVAYLESLQ
jgi:cytochrome c oxidase subunit 2